MTNAKTDIAIIGNMWKLMQKVIIIGPKNAPTWAIASTIPEQVAWIFMGKASVVIKTKIRIKARAK
jgi:hypothetical protein